MNQVGRVVLLSRDPSEQRGNPCHLNDKVDIFEMCSTPSTCQMLLQDQLGSNPHFVMPRK